MLSIIQLNYSKDSDEIEPHLQAHRQHLDRFYQQGLILASGPLSPRTGGMIIAKEMSKEALDALIYKDPFYLHGLAEYTIKHWNVTKSSAVFKCLIEPKEYSTDGRVLFDELHGAHHGEALIKALGDVSPDFVDMVYDFAAERIFARNVAIPMVMKELMAMVICMASGDMSNQVQSHAEAAINTGANIDMIIESMLIAIPFVGFPRVANALLQLKSWQFITHE
ncbi:MAG: YciI family protein [Francisellaceae bacterium]